MTALDVVLAVFVALMFYRLVERRHKILLAKIIGSLIALGALGGTLLVVVTGRQNRLSNERRLENRKLVSVTVDTITPRLARFLVCNQGTSELRRTHFTASGFFSGRSTAHPLETSERGYVSDIIVPPKHCVPMTWTGEYLLTYDSIGIAVEAAEFGDSNSSPHFSPGY